MSNQELKGKPGERDLEQWAKETDKGKHIFVWKHFMAGKEFQGWELLKSISEPLQDDLLMHTYMWSNTQNNEQLVKINILESTSWRQSQKNLLSFFDNFEAPSLDRAETKDINVGDIAFVGFGEIVQAITFSRANMLARVQSVGDEGLPVTEITAQLDRFFGERPAPSKEGVRPEFEHFEASSNTTAINEAITLSVEAIDPLKRDLWYKFIASGGELAVEDEQLRFQSNKEGKFEITAYAITEEGFAEGSTITVNVE
ncbi:hypothetical protein [Fodinibius halophilus]|uniref:Uncharacterized protein n=1 Tax=Fodinibius halophilus TaxID=1736908 RepID=A0A6M1TKI7_9BACT|nr:hypothetical protein [Fodinibius halophilus]NGP89030.1 hypothetical protein [Fodinibius halophilus]